MMRKLPTQFVDKVWGVDRLPSPFPHPSDQAIGEVWFEPPAELDQLLVKYIFASERLSVEELKTIAKKMGGVSPRAFLRDKDAAKFDIPATMGDEELFAAMAENPRLIQRPIGIKGDKAVLGRPIEKLLEIT